MRDLIDHAKAGGNLSEEQVEAAVECLLSTAVEEAAKGAFLEALRTKGETAGEIAAFVRSMLRRSIDPEIRENQLSGPLLDVCGTGGDRMNLFNVSTTAMFVVAAGGAVVVKHGNRGITSRCGGADVLEELGVRIDLPPAALRENIEKTGIGFLFAPNYHPSFKMIAPVRKALAARGVTTIFNLLGPLLNPARPPHQLVGVFSRSLLPAFAEAMALLRRKHAWIVHGSAGSWDLGIDEVSTMGPTDVAKVENGNAEYFSISPGQFGFQIVPPDALRGGGREENARILTGVLDGTIRGAMREVVVFNAAAGFVAANLARDLGEGIGMALEQLDSGGALAKLRLLQDPN